MSKEEGGSGEERVDSRADSLKKEQGDKVGDSAAQAETMLEESDARLNDPAVRDREDDSVERRTSEEASG